MRDDREIILKKVREALGGLPERAAYPEYEDKLAVAALRGLDGDLWEKFSERFVAVHGMPLDNIDSLVEYLESFGYTTGYCDPALLPVLSRLVGERLVLENHFDRGRLDSYAFGITRARAAIAETGTLVLTDRGTSSRLAALAPWVHIACLRRGDIVRDTDEATALLGDDPNVVWVTGPSKTADVEGILIEGVHGPGIQVCLLLPDFPDEVQAAGTEGND